MLVRDRLGTPVTEVGSLLDVRRIRKLKTLGHTENHQVLNFASEGIWVSGFSSAIFMIHSCVQYIARDPHTGTHIETFGAIALESDAMSGIVRIRARPFSDDTWHGKNPQDAVMMVPGLDVWKGRPEDFDTRNPEHVKLISYGKVVLFFRIRFQSRWTGYVQVHNLCMVEELLELKCSGQGGCREAGILDILFCNI